MPPTPDVSPNQADMLASPANNSTVLRNTSRVLSVIERTRGAIKAINEKTIRVSNNFFRKYDKKVAQVRRSKKEACI